MAAFQGDEQDGGAVLDVVVDAGLAQYRPQRQHRRGPFKGLDLGLLAHTAQCFGRRTKAKPADVADFRLQILIGGELERPRVVCGWIPKDPRPRQGRVRDRLAVAAQPGGRSLDDHWVIRRSAGGSVSVVGSISSWTAPIVGGFPDHGSPASLAHATLGEPRPHLDHRRLRAVDRLGDVHPGHPSAASRTIFTRSTTRAGDSFARASQWHGPLIISQQHRPTQLVLCPLTRRQHPQN